MIEQIDNTNPDAYTRKTYIDIAKQGKIVISLLWFILIINNFRS